MYKIGSQHGCITCKETAEDIVRARSARVQSEAELDAELRSYGIDPEEMDRRMLGKIEAAMKEGHDTPMLREAHRQFSAVVAKQERHDCCKTVMAEYMKNPEFAAKFEHECKRLDSEDMPESLVSASEFYAKDYGKVCYTVTDWFEFAEAYSRKFGASQKRK
jgi:hypothetical protein